MSGKVYHSFSELDNNVDVYNDVVVLRNTSAYDGHGSYDIGHYPVFYGCSKDIFQRMIKKIPPSDVIKYRHSDWSKYNIIQLMECGGCSKDCFEILKKYIPKTDYDKLSQS